MLDVRRMECMSDVFKAYVSMVHGVHVVWPGRTGRGGLGRLSETLKRAVRERVTRDIYVKKYYGLLIC